MKKIRVKYPDNEESDYGIVLKQGAHKTQNLIQLP